MPKRKITEFPSEEDDEKYEEVWDIRKIGIGIIMLLILIAGAIVGKQIVMGEKLHIPQVPLPSVMGVSTFNPPQTTKISIPSQQDVQDKLVEIQQQVTHLNVAELASSSPQVQQVIKQLQDLPQQPGSQAKQACINICNRL